MTATEESSRNVCGRTSSVERSRRVSYGVVANSPGQPALGDVRDTTASCWPTTSRSTFTPTAGTRNACWPTVRSSARASTPDGPQLRTAAGLGRNLVLLAREQLRQLRLHALRYPGAGWPNRRYPEAIDVMLMVIAEEPLRESAQTALIEAHLCEGNAIEARRQFELFATFVG